MDDIIQHLSFIRTTAEQEILSAETSDQLAGLRIKYLGKKSDVSQAMKLLSGLSTEQRPLVGKQINDVKNLLQEICDRKEQLLVGQEKQRRLAKERVDVTLPGRRLPLGRGGQSC